MSEASTIRVCYDADVVYTYGINGSRPHIMNRLSFSLAGTFILFAFTFSFVFAQETQTVQVPVAPQEMSPANFQGPPQDSRSFGAPQNFQGPPLQGGQQGGSAFRPMNDPRQGPPPSGQDQRFMGPNSDGRFQSRGGDSQGQMNDPRGPQGGEGGDDRGTQDLSRMKQQMKGMERGVSNLGKAIARIKKAGVSVPPEYESTVSELLAAIATVKNATETNDAVDEAMSVIQEKGSDMSELGPKIGMLEQFPRIVKDATKQITQARKMLTKAVAKAQKGGVDVTDIKSSIESKLSALETTISSAKANPDVEEAMDTLREDVFGNMEDLRDEMSILENISNSTKMLKDADKEISRITKAAATLKKQKKDTAELEGLIAEMKKALDDVRAMVQSKNVDQEELFAAFSNAEQIHNDALDSLAKLRGEKTDTDREFSAPDATKTSNLGATVYTAFQAIRDSLGL